MDDVPSAVAQARTLGVILFALAVFSITWVLRYTNGPGHIFLKLRELAGIQYYDEMDFNGDVVNTIEIVPRHKHFAEMFGCFWCLSTWVSLILLVALFPNIRIQAFILVWWGSIGISGFMHEIVAH